MKEDRLADYLAQIKEAAENSYEFTKGMDKAGFLNDKRTQQACVMSLMIIGEAAARIMEASPTFAESCPQLPWRNMRSMRNRIAHGYFEINLEIVWETIQTALPRLLDQMRNLPPNLPK
jgi:uncharacterized protein with HEPN domain